MLDAAQITAPMSSGFRPAACIASRAAITAISASTEICSFGRSGIRGAMMSGSITPALSITKRDLMPDAFSMNSTEECVFGSIRPDLISASFSRFQVSAQAL